MADAELHKPKFFSSSFTDEAANCDLVATSAPPRRRAAARLPNDFPIQFEVWEVFVMPHMVTRDYKPPAAA